MANNPVHTPHDGRPARRIYVDGKCVWGAFYADTRRGIVDAYRWPVKLHKYGKRALSRRLRGRVTVEYIHGE